MGDLIEYTPRLHELAYTFGGVTPVLEVKPGTALRIFTEDCSGGAVRGVADLPSQVCRFPYLNPVSGPFYVTGAEPGDTLALHLASIAPARDVGWSSTFPHFGALTSTHATATLQPPLDERVWRYPIDLDAGTVRYTARTSDYAVDLPLEPMLGTVGVAPAASEARATVVPDVHGGNMDTPELRSGVTPYLGVNVEGALFALGDGHARQGDGEASGVAVETAMYTVLIVDLIKGLPPTPMPRIESDTAISSVGSSRPLEDAYRMSQADLVAWVGDLTGLDVLDAYQLVAQAGRALVANVCDPNYTMLAQLPKPYLRGADAYGGAHSRLRVIAAAHY